jgi:EmrB/QacA subfamily drug resistance transporter
MTTGVRGPAMTGRHGLRPVLSTLMLGLFVTGASSTAVNTAIPAIGTGLDATFGELLWVVNSYPLLLAAVVIIAGRMGDLYGPRRLYVIGLVVVAVGSVAAGFAQSPTALIVARLVQAVGGAMVAPQSLSMISKIVPPERRGRAMGVWGAVAGLAVAIGPSLGGLIVSAWGWRWVFLVNVPVCLATAVLAMVMVPALEGGRRHRLDVLGAALAGTALFLVTYGLIEGESHGWGAVWGPVPIPAVIGAGVVLLGVFAWVERGRQDREPLLPFAIACNRNFALMALVTITLFGTVGAMLLLLSVLLQSAFGLAAVAAGLVIAIAPTVSSVIAPVSGRLTDLVGGKYLLVAGLALFAVGLGHVALVAGPGADWSDLLPGLVVIGVAMGVAFAPPMTIAMHDIDPAVAGAASGALATIRNFGVAMAAAVVGAIVQARLGVSLRDAARAEAGSLDPSLREPLLTGVAEASRGRLEVGPGQFHISIPANVLEQGAESLRGAADAVFRAGIADAVRVTFLVPAGLLAVSVLLTLGVRGNGNRTPTGPADPQSRKRPDRRRVGGDKGERRPPTSTRHAGVRQQR